MAQLASVALGPDSLMSQRWGAHGLFLFILTRGLCIVGLAVDLSCHCFLDLIDQPL